jgi:hypothetical protein
MNKELAVNSVTSQYGHTTSSFSERPPFINVPFSAVVNKILQCIIFVTFGHVNNIKTLHIEYFLAPLGKE